MEEDKKARKKPMTTAELFLEICSILEQKGLMPDILDYSLATKHPEQIKTYEFDLKNNLGYGSNEGIYVDLWIEYYEYEEDEIKCSDLGTFKTLNKNREAMRTMAGLLADFIVEEDDYVNGHLDDFTWTGADVHAVKDGKILGWGYTCRNMKSALRRKDKLLEDYPCVIIRDNATRKETEYKKMIEKGGI